MTLTKVIIIQYWIIFRSQLCSGLKSCVDKDLFETGLEEAAKWANNEMLKILIKHKEDPITSDLLQELMKIAIESDCNETVKIVKTLFTEGHHDVPEDVLNVARKRGIYSIMTTLGVLTMSDEEVNRRKQRIRENIKNGVASVSSKRPFLYFDISRKY